MKLPSGKTVYSSTPIYPGSNFSWGEATKNCTRPIKDLVIKGHTVSFALPIENKIIATAKNLDRVRAILGNRPLHINSWYRPPQINSRVGGSLYSRHQYGDAVDLVSYYYSPKDIFQMLDRLHEGGLSAYSSFVHIDWRGRRARW